MKRPTVKQKVEAFQKTMAAVSRGDLLGPTKQHLYEINPRSTPGYFIEAPSGVLDAEKYLMEHPEEDAIGVYHTYPSPGPHRRFVREVRRT
jgi:proteasome lid subunit RPN8/RPN11